MMAHLKPELLCTSLSLSQNRDNCSTMDLGIHEICPRLLDQTPLFDILGAVVDAFDARDLVRQSQLNRI